MRKYSVRIQKHLFIMLAISGTSMSLIEIIHTDSFHHFKCLPSLAYFSTWVRKSILRRLSSQCYTDQLSRQLLVTLICTATFTEIRPLEIFNGAIRITLISLSVLLGISGNLVWESFHARTSNAPTTLSKYGQCTVAILLGATAISVPRRPDVYDQEGHAVDRMRSTSIYSRFTYSWVNTLLERASKEGRLEEIDLPTLDMHRRSESLVNSFTYYQSTSGLITQLVLSHAWAFGLQFALTVLQSIVTFAPQFFLYR